MTGRRTITALLAGGHACDWPRFSGGHYGRIAGARERDETR